MRTSMHWKQLIILFTLDVRFFAETLDRSLSRQSALTGIDIQNLQLTVKLANVPSGEVGYFEVHPIEQTTSRLS